MKLCSLFLFSVFILALPGALFYSLTSEDFLNSDIAVMRCTHEGNIGLLEEVSNALLAGTNQYDLLWEYSALWYTEGQLYADKNDAKKSCFANEKRYAMEAVKVNPEGPDAHYWLGVGIGLWAEANGILDSLFAAGDIVNEMTTVIKLRPDFFHGAAWAIRAKVYDLAPGWPLSLGDKTKAYQDIAMALKYGGDYRFVIQTEVEMLMNDGRFAEAKTAAETGLALPYDTRIPVEEDQDIASLKSYLVIINSALR
ncbi:MAG: hypothetical protein ABSG94_06320 [Brevinematales bacterium]|jgi:hypothetical protein